MDEGKITLLLAKAWPALLLSIWLFAASGLIEFAYNAAKAFEKRAGTFLALRDVEESSWLHQQKHLTDPRREIGRWAFVALGIVAVLLMKAPWYWKLSWAFAVGTTFYYGGIGLWGAWVVTKGVGAVARTATEGQRLNVYHADRLAGLGFAVRYADVATLLLLTGLMAFPMALRMAQNGLDQQEALGYFLAGVVGMLLCVWAGFTVVATIRSRGAIATAIDTCRDTSLNDVADEKATLIAGGATKDQLELLTLKEDAAAQLRAGLFLGAGAWKDLFSVGAGAVSLVDLYGSFAKVLQP